MEYIATYGSEFGKGNTLEEAMQCLEDLCTHQPEFTAITFYKVEKIEVKQTLTIIE